MIETIPIQIDNIKGFRVYGTTHKQDIKPLIYLKEEESKLQEQLRLYVELEGMDGFSPNALIEDLKFNISRLNTFEKVAIITEEEWIEHAVELANALLETEIRSFSFSEKELAISWVIG